MNRDELMARFGGLLDDEALDLLLGNDKTDVYEAENLSEDFVGRNVNIKGRVTKVNGRRKVGEHTVATAFLGSLKLSFWDDAIDMLERIREGYEIVVINGLLRKRKESMELVVNRWSEIDVLSQESEKYFFPLDNLPINERVNIEGMVIERPSIRSFLKSNNDLGVVGSVLLSDGTNTVRIVAWDAAVRELKDVDIYESIRVYDCRVRKNSMVELHCDGASRIVRATQLRDPAVLQE
jgi:hypothetical protein